MQFKIGKFKKFTEETPPSSGYYLVKWPELDQPRIVYLKQHKELAWISEPPAWHQYWRWSWKEKCPTESLILRRWEKDVPDIEWACLKIKPPRKKKKQ